MFSITIVLFVLSMDSISIPTYMYTINSQGFKINIINYYKAIWITDSLLFIKVDNNVKSCNLMD